MFRAIPVGTVARAMLHDALEFHSSASTDKPADEEKEKPPFTIYKNHDIYRLYQVQLVYM